MIDLFVRQQYFVRSNADEEQGTLTEVEVSVQLTSA